MRYLLAGALALFAVPASACEQFERVEEILLRGYGERVQATLPTPPHYVLHIWSNPETGSWTITQITPNGCTAMIAAGIGAVLDFEPPGEDT